jgi:hypothetical protein
LDEQDPGLLAEASTRKRISSKHSTEQRSNSRRQKNIKQGTDRRNRLRLTSRTNPTGGFCRPSGERNPANRDRNDLLTRISERSGNGLRARDFWWQEFEALCANPRPALCSGCENHHRGSNLSRRPKCERKTQSSEKHSLSCGEQIETEISCSRNQ